jgi:beta-lactamase superfamily II metal-dependent hydrolase
MFCQRLLISCLGLLAFSFSSAQAQDRAAPASFTFWQLPNQTHSQMLSDVIRTPNGKIVVIDGGTAGDAAYLAEFLKGLGNRVDTWFITHAHDDHFNALREILKNPAGLEIKTIHGSLPDAAWIEKYGDKDERTAFSLFQQAMSDAGRTLLELTLGQHIEIDGVLFEVLGVKNPEITKNPINNSSAVIRISDARKSVLVLGDLGLQGGEKLLKSPLAERLPSEYVQMAHHGQNGVSEAFYQCVNPSYCIWPTPKWLWDNDKGGGKGSGHWRTLEVRAWMDKLPIKTHYVMHEGLQKIE